MCALRPNRLQRPVTGGLLQYSMDAGDILACKWLGIVPASQARGLFP